MRDNRAVHFDFATATEVVFGAGTRHMVAERARQLGALAFVVTGRDADRARWLVDALAGLGMACVAWPVCGEPTIDDARAAVARARAAHVDVVVAVGGGSVIDLGKAIATLLANGGDPLDYLEVIGAGRPLTQPSVPFIAVPTTAGTGAEVTRNAVLTASADGVKASMRSLLMLPTLAIVDPELTLGLPPALTATTGMDALTQVIEPYLSVRANPMTDGFCVEGMTRAARSLRRAVEDGGDLDARTDMALASLVGGLALANAGLGAVHGFAAPIGGRYGAPHGAVCAALLPAVMRVNLQALRARAAGSATLGRFTSVARLLTGDASATADDAVVWLEDLRTALDIPGLTHHGVTSRDAPDLGVAASRTSSMRGNCIALDAGELEHIIALAS